MYWVGVFMGTEITLDIFTTPPTNSIIRKTSGVYLQ